MAVVARLTDAAPLLALAPAELPIPDDPLKAITVSDWCADEVCVLETVTLVRRPDAVAVQISESPKLPACRLTRVQVRPAPLTVTVCPFAAPGPSEATNATSTSFGFVVLKAAVVRLPAPSEKTILSTVGAVSTTFDTVTATGPDVALLPAASRATADRECAPLATADVF